MRVRDEQPADQAAIDALIASAFAGATHSSGTEAAIVDELRRAGALAVSLVAEDHDGIVGHVAFSPVTVSDGSQGWFGLGPVAVRPDRKREGIGQALIRCGLDRLRDAGANGCVVLGEPEYYARFGFEEDARLRYPGVPSEYFQRLDFGGGAPSGTVAYHPAFAI